MQIISSLHHGIPTDVGLSMASSSVIQKGVKKLKNYLISPMARWRQL